MKQMLQNVTFASLCLVVFLLVVFPVNMFVTTLSIMPLYQVSNGKRYLKLLQEKNDKKLFLCFY